MITWSIPLLTIMLLGGVTWIGSHDLDPARPLVSKEEPLDVQVVSLDWKWLFIYPDQRVASVNRLVIPAGTPVHFTLTSASVMNAFFIPDLGSMIYTMNRMATNLNLIADEPGEFLGLSTMFSGDGFADMHFNVEAVAAGVQRLGRPGARRRPDARLGRLQGALQAEHRRAVRLLGLGRPVPEDSRQTLPPGLARSPRPTRPIVATASRLCMGRGK